MKSKIKLLDGKYYDRVELLERMEDDSFYYGELNKLALSSSSLKQLLSSPKTYKFSLEYGSGESQALRDGWLFHTAILEPEVFAAQTFIDVQSKNTKKFREAKAENPRVFTAKERSDADRLVDAFYRNEHAKELITKAEFEIPAIDNVLGFPFRGKADVIGFDYIADLKTTGNLKDFKWAAKKYGYDAQAYIYCNLFDIDYKNFHFFAIDKGTGDLGIYDITENFYNSGKDKVEYGIKVFEKYFVNKEDEINSYIIKDTLD